MRLIPVIDLLDGHVVHAIRGERERYRPMKSTLVDGSAPTAIAKALLDAAQSTELYVADLGALRGGVPDTATISALARLGSVLADAGTATAASAAALERAGVSRIVVGTESLGPDGLAQLTDVPVTLSLDLRDGRLVSQDPALSGEPVRAARTLADQFNVTDVVIIDLVRVGSDDGPAAAAVEEVAGWGRPVIAGGGVRGIADVDALTAAGASGVLVATALHTGALMIPSSR
jgi:phosphoribosylformimino-5-aminoimidazole carboxamide ribotide isomerase